MNMPPKSHGFLDALRNPVLKLTFVDGEHEKAKPVLR